MTDVLTWWGLATSAPTAAAVIVVVVLFLKHLRAERESRDHAQGKFLAAIQRLSEPIHELTLEVRSLRDEHLRDRA